MQRGVVLGCVALLIMCFGQSVTAQQTFATNPPARSGVLSSVLTIDSERLFLESAFGRRVAAEVEAQGNVLASENRRIEADLEAEEKRLTELRPTMEPDVFRALAEEFDEKVQLTRSTQAAKGRALNDLLEQEREVFLSAAAPVLERLMREAGAVVILERRSVFVSASAVEITDDAISLLDETLGSGAD